MATPRILETFDDLVVRDILHRHIDSRTSTQTIEHVYSHTSGNTANVLAAISVSVDAWNLLLDPNTVNTTAISLTSESTVLRNANVSVMGNLQLHECTANVGAEYFCHGDRDRFGLQWVVCPRDKQ